MRLHLCCHCIAGILVTAGEALSQETTRVSVRTNGGQANGHSYATAISPDGRYVAFGSFATNLVNGDTNAKEDVFVHDRVTGVTERVSVDSSGAQGDKDSMGGSISGDGRIVGFVSHATNLVAGDTNGSPDTFVHDRSTGITECVSVNTSGAPGNNWSSTASFSSDGRFVAFSSYSSDLVSNDTNGTSDIFLRDRQNGTTDLISIDSFGNQANGSSAWPVISPNGTVITFASAATNLVAGDTNGCTDVFVHDRFNGITERVNLDSTGNEGNGQSNFPQMSHDGQIIAFQSFATNLDTRDNNGYNQDIYVHDRRSGVTELVSLSTSGSSGNDESRGPAGISADGRFIAFVSFASDLITNDTNNFEDFFVRDMVTGITERVSVDSSGNEGNWASYGGGISANGELVAFWSSSSNLVSNDTNNSVDSFVRDRCDAIWLNYGAGFSGTNGIPAFTAQSDPVLGSTLTLDLDNSYGATTVGLLLLGFARQESSTNRGGTLLVAPTFLIPMSVPAVGASIAGTVPNAPALCDFTIDLQALELDPGAVNGVSFTPGLELILGK